MNYYIVPFTPQSPLRPVILVVTWPGVVICSSNMLMLSPASSGRCKYGSDGSTTVRFWIVISGCQRSSLVLLNATPVS